MQVLWRLYLLLSDWLLLPLCRVYFLSDNMYSRIYLYSSPDGPWYVTSCDGEIVPFAAYSIHAIYALRFPLVPRGTRESRNMVSHGIVNTPHWACNLRPAPLIRHQARFRLQLDPWFSQLVAE